MKGSGEYYETKTQTETKIKHALTNLLCEKSLEGEEITVNEISRLSKINRESFYLHYLNKYDLISKLEVRLYDWGK